MGDDDDDAGGSATTTAAPAVTAPSTRTIGDAADFRDLGGFADVPGSEAAQVRSTC